METLYSILRANSNGIGVNVLMYADSLEAARAFMRRQGLKKTGERHFTDYALVQWFVA